MPLYSSFNRRKPPHEPEDQLNQLVQAGPEAIHYDGTLPSATATATQLLTNRYKKRWDSEPRLPATRMPDQSKDETAAHAPPMPESTSAAQDVPLASRLFTTPTDAQRLNWIARALERSWIARVAYLLVLVSIYTLALPYAVDVDDDGWLLLLTLINTIWLTFDALTAAGNNSRFSVIILCLYWIPFFMPRAPQWDGDRGTNGMKVYVGVPVLVILLPVAAYTAYE